MKIILTERKIRSIVKNVINEISNELISRAWVKSNANLDDLRSDDDQTAVDNNGRKVHRLSQIAKRERQRDLFRRTLGKKLSRNGRDVTFTSDDRGEDRNYSVDIDKGHHIYHHVAPVNGSNGASVYNDKVRDIGRSDMDLSDEMTDWVDAMVGYHNEITKDKPYRDNIEYYDNRIEDVNNINQYDKDMEDYNDEMKRNREEIETYNQKPWWKKMFKERPKKSTRIPPKSPEIKTGPYFMPKDTVGLEKRKAEIERNHQRQKDAYDRILKPKKRQ